MLLAVVRCCSSLFVAVVAVVAVVVAAVAVVAAVVVAVAFAVAVAAAAAAAAAVAVAVAAAVAVAVVAAVCVVSLLSCCCFGGCCCCCCWQHVRLPPWRAERFRGWHVVNCEFGHSNAWEINLGMFFRSGFCGAFLQKQHVKISGLHCTQRNLNRPFRIGFCGAFPEFSGSIVPTLDFSHISAWTSACIGPGRGGG